MIPTSIRNMRTINDGVGGIRQIKNVAPSADRISAIISTIIRFGTKSASSIPYGLNDGINYIVED